MTLKEKITNLIIDFTDELEGELEFLTSGIDKANIGYSKASEALSEIQAQVQDTKVWAHKERTEIEFEKKTLQEERNRFEQERNAFVLSKDALQAELITKTAEKSRLDRDIKDRETILHSTENLTIVKQELLNELSQLSLVIEEKKSIYKELLVDIEESFNEHRVSTELFQKENEDRIQKIDFQIENIMVREANLAQISKEQNIKENDLRIVEQRWRKIYESKGASFKV